MCNWNYNDDGKKICDASKKEIIDYWTGAEYSCAANGTCHALILLNPESETALVQSPLDALINNINAFAANQKTNL